MKNKQSSIPVLGFQAVAVHKISGLLLAFCLGSPSLQAIGFRIPNQDAFATGRANAFVATADNPSAVYYNPAGLTNLEGTQASAGLYLFTMRSKFSGDDGNSARNRNQIQPVPHGFLTHRAEGSRIAWGLGLAAPFGLSNEWPENTSFQAIAIKGELTYLSLMPAVAVQLTPTLSIGGGPTLNQGEIDLTRNFPFPLPTGSVMMLRTKTQGNANSVGANFGVFWQPHPKHAFGASFRSRDTLNLKGSLEMEQMGSQSIRADFPLPEFFVIGYSHRPTENWNFEANVDWTRWSRLKSVRIEQPDGNLIDELPFHWKSSTMVNFGVTRYFHDGFRAGGGYTFSENSVPSTFFNPLTPDGDRHLGTVAFGRNHNRLDWEIALQYGYSPTRNINNPPVEGSFRTQIAAAIFTIGYTF